MAIAIDALWCHAQAKGPIIATIHRPNNTSSMLGGGGVGLKAMRLLGTSDGTHRTVQSDRQKRSLTGTR